MTDKKSFVMYKSWDPMIKDLDDASVGILMKAAFAYQCGYEYEIENPVIRAVFAVMVAEFEKNEAKYQEVCEKNAENVRKRWAAAKGEEDTTVYDRIRPNTNAYDSIRNDTKNTDSDSDSDRDNDSDKDRDRDIESDVKPSGKRKQSKREAEVVPTYVKDPILNATILEFLDYRKQMRSSMSDIAVTKMLAKLEKIGKSDHERVEILNQSMENGWKGIFPLDKVKPRKQEIDWEAL